MPLTNEIVDERLKNRNIQRIDDIINSETKINWKCLLCNKIWCTRPSTILNQKCGCPSCNRKNGAKTRVLTNEIIDNRLGNRKIKRLDNIINGSIKIKWQCLDDLSHTWSAVPHTVLYGTGCPFCKNKNERIIYDYLTSNNIEFIHECDIRKINKFAIHRYRVDFYIPSKNIVIEYNGRQHYEPTRLIKKKFLENKLNII